MMTDDDTRGYTSERIQFEEPFVSTYIGTMPSVTAHHFSVTGRITKIFFESRFKRSIDYWRSSHVMSSM
jgi:hypothetical protein